MKNCVVCLLPFACILAQSASNTAAGKREAQCASPTDCCEFTQSKPYSYCNFLRIFAVKKQGCDYPKCSVTTFYYL